MIDALFGGKTAEKVLLYIQNYGEGYALAIARKFSTSLSAIQKQLQKFESAGILVSQMKGKTRLYMWNPRYAFKNELQSLLTKALSLVPKDETKLYFRNRQRPRRFGKPL